MIFHSQSDQGLRYLPFWPVCSESPLLAILSSLIKVYTICHSQQSNQGLHYLLYFLSSIIMVCTVCHSQQSDKGPHYLPFSAVWSGSTLIAILSSLIRVYASCHSQFDQGHFRQSHHGLHYLPFFLRSIIKVYTVCHFQQSDQVLHCLPFSAVRSASTMFAILSSLIRVYIYIIWHSQSDQCLQFCHSFLAVLSRSILFAILILIRVYSTYHYQQFDQGLHYLPFSVWSGSTVFAILSSLIRV